MSFFFTKNQAKKFTDVEVLHKLECRVCPLYNIASNKNKDIAPNGSLSPDIYVMGLGPGREEDLRGQFFIGTSGTYLKSNFTAEQMKKLRFNNVVRTRPPNDEPPFEAIECCRPSVERDIALTKPKIILGLGGYPLHWVLGTNKQPSINAWRGHRFPINIAGHICWYYPAFHPAYITREVYLDPVFKLDIANVYKLLERNLAPEVVDPKTIFDNCYPLYKLADIKKALIRLWKEPCVSVDLETTPTRPYALNAKILSISVGTKNYAIAFPWQHPQAKWTAAEFEELRVLFHRFLLNKQQVKVAHNAAFEQEYLVWEFDDPFIARANWKDTMSDAYCLGFGGNSKDNTDGHERLFKGLLSLDNLCRIYFGFFLKNYSQINRTNLEREPLEKVLLYNCGDTKWDHALLEKLEADVEFERLQSIVAEHDRRIPTVVLTQAKGLHYSKERAEKHSAELGGKLSKIYNDIYSNPSVIEYQSKFSKFNVGAPADVSYLFKYLGFKVEREVDGKTKLSSDDEILKAIDHPVARGILSYRELEKLKGTYVDIFLPGSKNYVVYPDGLVHGSFTTHFTTTGRLSSQDPNLQNFPKRRNKEIRDIIVAPPGFVFASCDFGQLEYRVLVMASKDPKLVKYVWDGTDVHAEWAIKSAKKYPQRVGGKEIVDRWTNTNPKELKDKDKLFKAYRDIVKNTFVFAAFYGAGVNKLSKGLGLPKDLTQELYDEFWQEFAGVKTWHEWAYAFYAENGYIETLTKRRRYAYIQGGEIINMPIQGTGSDIVVDGMNRLSEYAMETEQDQFQPIINIHDDLGFYLPEATWEQDLNKVIQMMVDCKYDFINVPVSVEASVGPDWYNQKAYGVFDNSVELKERLVT